MKTAIYIEDGVVHFMIVGVAGYGRTHSMKVVAHTIEAIPTTRV